MARGEVRYRLTADTKDFEGGFKRAEGAMDKTAMKAGRLADAIGKTSTTMARSASLFGLPADALRKLDDAADIAELGLNNLSKAAAGFNMASVGVVGAGLAIGAALGGAARKADSLNNPLIDLAQRFVFLGTTIKEVDAAMAEMFKRAQGIKDLSPMDAAVAATRGEISKRLADAAGMKAQMGEIAKWREIVEGHLAGGSSVEDIARLYGDKLPASIKDWMEAAQRAAAAHKKATEEAKRGLTELLNFQDRVTRGVEDSIGAMFDAQSEAFMASGTDRSSLIPETLLTPMRRGPNLSAVMGGVASGAIIPGAPTAGVPPGVFQAAFAQLPQILLGALQGGGGIGRSLGGLFGGAAGSKLLSGGIGKLLGGTLGSVLPGLGTLLGGVVGGGISKLFGGLFGGGPSKEEREAERQKKEAERERIQSAARAMRSEGISGLMEGAGSFAFRADAQHHGTIFAAAWSAVVKEKGIVAAAEAFGGAFDKMKADIEARGIEMPAWMQAVAGQMGLGKNEAFRAAANQGQAAAGFLGSFGKSGGLTPDVLRAFEQEARATFAAGKGAALEMGKGAEEATEAGFAAANPLLKGLLNESVASGQTLSADIQEMIKAQGIVPDVEFQQLDELRNIRAAVGGLAPAWAGGAGGGAGNGGINPDIYADLPQMEGGGRRAPGGGGGGGSAAGTPVVIHDDETVVPDEDAGDWARAVLNASGGGAGSSASVLAAIANRPSVTIEQPVEINLAIAPGVTRSAIDEAVAGVEAALRENRSAIPRLLQKAGFVRR